MRSPRSEAGAVPSRVALGSPQRVRLLPPTVEQSLSEAGNACQPVRAARPVACDRGLWDAYEVQGAAIHDADLIEVPAVDRLVDRLP